MQTSRYSALFMALAFQISTAFAQEPVNMPSHSKVLESHPFYMKPALGIRDTTLNGAMFDLDEHVDQIVVLHFWSLRCAVCFKEIPELNLIADEYADKKVLIVSMMDDSIEAVNEKIQVDGNFYKLRKPVFGYDKISFEIIPDAKETMLQYKSEYFPFGFPTTYFLKNGKLREFSFGYVQGYGNPKPAESRNYLHIKGILESLLASD